MFIESFKLSFLDKGLLLFFIFCTLSGFEIKAQTTLTAKEEAPVFMFDEIPVHVLVEGVDDFCVDALCVKNKLLYVNVENLFKFLDIQCVVDQKGNRISGFIEKESHIYSINLGTKQIKVGDKIVNVKNGLVKEAGVIYLESSLFAEAFGITLTFSFSSLSMILKSDFELPVIKQKRLEKMQSNNTSKIKDKEVADTILRRAYHLFKFGTLDWSVASSQTRNAPTENQFGLSIGTEFLYGEADVSVNYYNQQKIDNRQLQYLWRWVDNDKSIIKQAQVGKISTQTISFINSPMIGAVVRNTPTTIRKATGYYTINESTEPNWTVQLYINNVMVDFTKADASGAFMFKIPIVYGYTTLKLKFYGTMGEERTEERTMNIPYTVMPAHEFEYGLSLGVLQDSSLSRFGKGEFNYGVNRFLTVGGGLEYLSSIPNGAFIPYATAVILPFSNLTLNAEFAYGVRTRCLLNYYFWKNALLEVEYNKYVEGQLATRFNAPEERKVKLSIPFRTQTVIGFAKIDYAQLVYKAFSYNQANMMLSANYKQFGASSSTQLNWVNPKLVYVTSDLSLSTRLINGYTVRPSVQYNATENKLTSCKVAIEKFITKGYLSVSYEKNILFKDNFINLNFKYDLSFGRTNFSTSQSKGNMSTSEGAQGSLAFGSGNNYIHVNNSSSVSKGGISLYPFLDLNHNGVFDHGEPMVRLSTVRIMGSKVIFSEKDSIVRIPDLNAFTNYALEFRDSDLENIAWRFKNKKYQVLIDPNQFKRIDIPIIPIGEVSGMAYMNNDNSLKGIGRIIVKFYKKNNKNVVAETLSESDGYISYMGLEPGEYVARIDSVQLNNLGFTVDSPRKGFTIKKSEEGDIISGVDFILRPMANIALESKNETSLTVGGKLSPPTTLAKLRAQKDMQKDTLTYLTEQVSIEKDTKVSLPGDTLYKVQLLALRKSIKVKNYFTQLLVSVPGLTIEETLGEDRLYHYSTGNFSSIVDARRFIRVVRRSGWKDCFVAIYVGNKRAEKTFHLKRKIR